MIDWTPNRPGLVHWQEQECCGTSCVTSTSVTSETRLRIAAFIAAGKPSDEPKSVVRVMMGFATGTG